MPRATGSVVEVLRDLARAFRALGVSWYLFGAQALVLRGCPRATADVDVTVLLGRQSTARLVGVLQRHGLTVRFSDEAFLATTRVLPVVHDATSLPVDIVLGGPGLEELFAEAAQPVRVGRLQVPVATSTHLVLMKVLAARPKDLEDAKTLLVARAQEIRAPELDQLAQALAEALADDAILANLAEARRQAARLAGAELSPGRRKAKRRRKP